jgi:hypothetical protein
MRENESKRLKLLSTDVGVPASRCDGPSAYQTKSNTQVLGNDTWPCVSTRRAAPLFALLVTSAAVKDMAFGTRLVCSPECLTGR